MGGTISAQYGGSGGADYNYTCPADQLIWRFPIQSGDWINAISPGCYKSMGTLVGQAGSNGGKSSIPSPLGPYVGFNVAYNDKYVTQLQFKNHKGESTPTYGKGAGTKASFNCQTGYALNGISGRSGQYLDSIKFTCSPFYDYCQTGNGKADAQCACQWPKSQYDSNIYNIGGPNLDQRCSKIQKSGGAYLSYPTLPEHAWTAPSNDVIDQNCKSIYDRINKGENILGLDRASLDSACSRFLKNKAILDAAKTKAQNAVNKVSNASSTAKSNLNDITTNLNQASQAISKLSGLSFADAITLANKAKQSVDTINGLNKSANDINSNIANILNTTQSHASTVMNTSDTTQAQNEATAAENSANTVTSLLNNMTDIVNNVIKSKNDAINSSNAALQAQSDWDKQKAAELAAQQQAALEAQQKAKEAAEQKAAEEAQKQAELEAQKQAELLAQQQAALEAQQQAKAAAEQKAAEEAQKLAELNAAKQKALEDQMALEQQKQDLLQQQQQIDNDTNTDADTKQQQKDDINKQIDEIDQAIVDKQKIIDSSSPNYTLYIIIAITVLIVLMILSGIGIYLVSNMSF